MSSIGTITKRGAENFITVSPAKQVLHALSSIGMDSECANCPNVGCAGQNCFGIDAETMKTRKEMAKKILGITSPAQEENDAVAR